MIHSSDMNLAHKIRLYPNNKQVTYFKRACGHDCRFIVDRDVNAARNLRHVALEFGEIKNACGDVVSLVVSGLEARVTETETQQPALKLAGV